MERTISNNGIISISQGESFVTVYTESEEIMPEDMEEYYSEDYEPQYDEYAKIGTLYVAPEARQQGLGRKLLQAAIKEARELNDTIRIVASPDEDVISMDALVAFYESAGFYVIDADGYAVVMEM